VWTRIQDAGVKQVPDWSGRTQACRCLYGGAEVGLGQVGIDLSHVEGGLKLDHYLLGLRDRKETLRHLRRTGQLRYVKARFSSPGKPLRRTLSGIGFQREPEPLAVLVVQGRRRTILAHAERDPEQEAGPDSP
jgi:hypothetical protein